MGSRRLKTTHQAVKRTPTTGQQSFQGVEIYRTWCPCYGSTTIPTPAASMGTEGTKCQPMATSQIDIHTRWGTFQIICGSTPDGTKYQQHRLMWWRKVILDERMPSTTKGNKCEDRCTHRPIVRAPQLSESDSPQVQNSLSTDNNKGGSVLIPLKPTINLVPKKDIPGGDATTS